MNLDCTVQINLDGEPYGDPLPGVVEVGTGRISTKEAVTIEFDKGGRAALTASNADGVQLVVLQELGNVTPGMSLHFDAAPVPTMPTMLVPLLTDAASQDYRAMLDFYESKEGFLPEDRIDQLRLATADRLMDAARQVRADLESNVRGRVLERARKNDQPLDERLCNLPVGDGKACTLSPGHHGATHSSTAVDGMAPGA